ncbi:relaxase/mobilization nuclease domain-containing protein [Chitinophaga sp. 212800010-3]|uniref:relaxase/mobilization nuclease domain-containing protein n=1 Tax=unclassified Chitinophaga TaxID=2619133 RepID=UPI002DF4D9F8|nr:Relaxase/mobilization nuclease domain-containing protein [Chitinophaga sp. 212800010-3]
MVGKIESGPNIRGALNYNENKVKAGKATLIGAGLYHKDADKLSFNEKISRLQHRADLHGTAKHKCIHISINLDPSENIPNEMFLKLAAEYMELIGLEQQPYLVYRHSDVAHPHIHIVTTSILPTGKQKNLHNLGRKESFAACREIERRHNLIAADKVQPKMLHTIKPVDITKVEYGLKETKAAIGRILYSVLANYDFGSFAELNAILKQYNIVADPGAPGTRMEKHKGLVYSMLDEKGKKIGVPIKASKYYFKAKLSHIETLAEKGEQGKKRHRQDLKMDIEEALRKSASRADFIQVLSQKHINAVFRSNADGRFYGLTFIDNKRGCVFNGSDIDREFSCKKILDRLDRPYLHQAKEQHFNKQFSEAVIAETDFSNGYKNVLAEWSAKGLLIQSADGKAGFQSGHFQLPNSAYNPVPAKIAHYLRANAYSARHAVAIEKFLRSNADKFALDISMSPVTPVPTVFIAAISQFFTNLFQPVEQDPVDVQWLRESKKKRKRRRPS